MAVINDQETKCYVSIFDFFKLFPDETAAVWFVEKQVWQDGFKCRFCGSDKTSPKLHVTVLIQVLRQGFHGSIRHELREFAAASCQMAVRNISCTNQPQEHQQLAAIKRTGCHSKNGVVSATPDQGSLQAGDRVLANIVEVDEIYIDGKDKEQIQQQETQVRARACWKTGGD